MCVCVCCRKWITSQVRPEIIDYTSAAVHIKWPGIDTVVEYTAHWLYTHDCSRTRVQQQRHMLVCIDERVEWNANTIQGRP